MNTPPKKRTMQLRHQHANRLLQREFDRMARPFLNEEKEKERQIEAAWRALEARK